MKTMLQGWNFMRIFRLVLGAAIVVQGVIAKDVLTIILGFIFGGMAVANIGCCGTSGCAIKPSAGDKTKTTNYEELVNKK